ncbi:glycosyltransferase [Clostridium sp.]
MKVLQINSICGVGSTGRIATDLYKVLEEQGHECVIAYGRGTSPDGIKAIKIGAKIDNYFHVVKTRFIDKHGFASIQATKKFIKKVKKYDPDIIHLHNIHGYYINIELLFEYLIESNKPVVWTLHDCWSFTGHCANFDYVGCEKWKMGCYNCPQNKIYPTSLLMDNSKWNYQKKKELFASLNNITIVTPSKWLGNLVKQSFLGKYPAKVINNGIDLKVFKPTESDFRQRHNLKNKYIILGVASQWNIRKGLKYFIELEGNLDEAYKIVLVGVTEKQKKKLPKNIITIIRTNNVKELVEIYSVADVFVNPTLEDNFPTTNLEALACGTPVITFKTGGSTESIDTDTGIVVVNKTINDLIKAIDSLKKRDLTDNCVKKALKKYEKNYCYQKYIVLYKQMEVLD